MLDSLFKLSQQQTTLRREALAGVFVIKFAIA